MLPSRQSARRQRRNFLRGRSHCWDNTAAAQELHLVPQQNATLSTVSKLHAGRQAQRWGRSSVLNRVLKCENVLLEKSFPPQKNWPHVQKCLWRSVTAILSRRDRLHRYRATGLPDGRAHALLRIVPCRCLNRAGHTLLCRGGQRYLEVFAWHSSRTPSPLAI